MNETLSNKFIDQDGLNKFNPLDDYGENNLDYEVYVDYDDNDDYEYYIPPQFRNKTLRFLPPRFHDFDDPPKYFNELHYHITHCPYSVEYVEGTMNPNIFHEKCMNQSSTLGWPGKCIQTYENITIPGNDSTLLLFKHCRFAYL